MDEAKDFNPKAEFNVMVFILQELFKGNMFNIKYFY